MRPPVWTAEDEKALRDEFTATGDCECDRDSFVGGCPYCVEELRLKWWAKRHDVVLLVPKKPGRGRAA